MKQEKESILTEENEAKGKQILLSVNRCCLQLNQFDLQIKNPNREERGGGIT